MNLGLDREPFSLGFPGESWNTPLTSLVIPMPDGIVLVSRRSGKYEVFDFSGWREVDGALMAAAWVWTKLESYQQSPAAQAHGSYHGGKNVEQEKG